MLYLKLCLLFDVDDLGWIGNPSIDTVISRPVIAQIEYSIHETDSVRSRQAVSLPSPSLYLFKHRSLLSL